MEEQLLQYLQNVYYWASQGCIDVVPAGIIAVDLGLNKADLNDSEIKKDPQFSI